MAWSVAPSMKGVALENIVGCAYKLSLMEFLREADYRKAFGSELVIRIPMENILDSNPKQDWGQCTCPRFRVNLQDIKIIKMAISDKMEALVWHHTRGVIKILATIDNIDIIEITGVRNDGTTFTHTFKYDKWADKTEMATQEIKVTEKIDTPTAQKKSSESLLSDEENKLIAELPRYKEKGIDLQILPNFICRLLNNGK